MDLDMRGCTASGSVGEMDLNLRGGTAASAQEPDAGRGGRGGRSAEAKEKHESELSCEGVLPIGDLREIFFRSSCSCSADVSLIMSLDALCVEKALDEKEKNNCSFAGVAADSA
jgi:hypothetical protein